MTPEERRERAEYVAKMAEQGILAEPPYDREEWRDQPSRSAPKARKASKSGAESTVSDEAPARSKRRTA